MTTTVAGDSPYTYTPVEHILLNCGSSDNSTASEARIWIGDVNSNYLTHSQSQIQSSLTASAVKQALTVPRVPFTDARLSLARSPTHSPSLRAKNSNFNASLNADADSGPTISREYCVNIEEDQRLNITFTPSPNVSNSYAFINGIEVLSMPTNLYFTPVDDPGILSIGRQNLYRVVNSTSLEMVYRLNVGGRTISPANDTGMFREWQHDSSYLKEYGRMSFLPFNDTIKLKNTVIPPYTAPEDLFRTARTMGYNSTLNLSYNLTWQFPVDSGFDYLIRLYFCEFQPEIIQTSDRSRRILWSGGKGVPVYKDYAISMREGTEKKVNLYVAIGTEPRRWKTSYQDAILNGVEIFKISDFNGNLAVNPAPLPPDPPTIPPPGQSQNSKGNRTKIISVATDGVAGFIVLSC
ncbi:receptor-like protein kinase FERONIA [Juglans microcarpa x Juglans regia]|uniref:receptor-like protein kinase FERONIA n=1 Tax=Juglans microcarpa x Juglans regia TaxID=2249226 RepID=UPI001B7DFE74|nr:receptor-like protein kinase FERONIA [Juglans microcarpa x Juglans regia]